MQTAKTQLREILERLPDDATVGDIRLEVDDALYTLYIKQAISQGLQASREGRVTPHSEVKRRFRRHAG